MRYLVLAILFFGAATADDKKPTAAARELDRIARQAHSRDGNVRQKVWDLCERIIASPDETAATKIKAHETRIQVKRRIRKHEEYAVLAEEMLKAFPENKGAMQKAYAHLFDAYYNRRQPARFKEVLDRFEKAFPDDMSRRISNRNRLIRLYLRQRKTGADNALALVRETLPLAGGNDELTAESLRLADSAAGKKKLYEEQLGYTRRLLEPGYSKYLRTRDQHRYRQHVASLLHRLKRFAEMRAFCRAQQKLVEDRHVAQDFARRIAYSFRDEEKHEDAIQAFEDVFVGYPQITSDWWNLQMEIARCLERLGRRKEAIQAARIAFDAAEHGNVNSPGWLIINNLKELDRGQVERANAFVRHTYFGPAGPDGRPGTADDVRDILAEDFPRPDYPARRRAFAAARDKGGDRWEDSRYRAWTYIYSGRPKQACPEFLDAFRRADRNEMLDAARRLVIVGTRSVRNTFAGVDAELVYVMKGPAGPDGKVGTADDLSNPFLAVLPAGKLSDLPAGMTAAEAKLLRQTRELLQGIVDGKREDRHLRRAAVYAIGRIHEALMDTGGMQDWHAGLYLWKGDRHDFWAALSTYLRASRGRDLHLAGVFAAFERLNKGEIEISKDGRREYGRVKRDWDHRLKRVRIYRQGLLDRIPAGRFSAGGKPGLKATYFEKKDFKGKSVSRRDAEPRFHWSKEPAKGIPADRFSVRWEGELTPLFSGKTYIQTVSDDGVRVWIGDKNVINSWRGGSQTRSGTVDLTKGKAVPIKIELFDDRSHSRIEIRWGQVQRHEFSQRLLAEPNK